MATNFLDKKNNAKTTITNNPLTAGGLSITLSSSSGSKFPTGQFLATIWDAATYTDPGDDSNMEVVLCDSRSGDTVTVNASGRGYAGTTGVEHATGSAFRLLIMKEHMEEYETAINALEALTPVIHRQDKTSNTQISTAPKIQFGWGYLQGNNSAQVADTVTFPVAFTTSAPVVVCQIEAGYTTSAPAAISTAADAIEGVQQGLNASWDNVSLTQVQIYLNRVNNNFASGRYYRYTWAAYGI